MGLKYFNLPKTHKNPPQHNASEREVKIALRKTLFKCKLHQNTELFGRAYEYIRKYY